MNVFVWNCSIDEHIVFLLKKIKDFQFWLHLLTHWTLNAQRVPNLVWNSSLNHTSNTQTAIHANIWISSRRTHYTCIANIITSKKASWLKIHCTMSRVSDRWLVTFHKLCSLFHSFDEKKKEKKIILHTA